MFVKLKLVLSATSETVLLFKGKFYNQIDGVAMGSPSAVDLANLVLGYHETKLLNKCNLTNLRFV